VALSLAVIANDPASASPPDAAARWSIVPSPNGQGPSWLVAVKFLNVSGPAKMKIPQLLIGAGRG